MSAPAMDDDDDEGRRRSAGLVAVPSFNRLTESGERAREDDSKEEAGLAGFVFHPHFFCKNGKITSQRWCHFTAEDGA